MSAISRRTFLGGLAAGAAASVVRAVPTPATEDTDVFSLGVASGDPSADGVVLWTRLDPERFHGTEVAWSVFPTNDPSIVLASGTAAVDGGRDGTVQVPVGGLPAGERLGYRFTAEGRGRGRAGRGRPALAGPTIEGRTSTLPSNPSSLRIGVTSCGKHSDGYFNAYRELAAMECDLVLHLGDYIYASASGGTGDPLGRWSTIESRRHDPDVECTGLDLYRARYRQYRSDPDLRALHASVPVVPVWDDNDIANNAWRDGNQAGDSPDVWAVRKREGQQAWSEYLPTRVGAPDANGNLAIWRRIQSGTLLDLLMLDTRLQRDQQVSNAAGGSTAANDDPARTMLGAPQRQWLTEKLTGVEASAATWRVIGQGIVMTHWRIVGTPEQIGRLRHDIPLVADSAPSQRLADGGVYWNSDGWDGYAYERARLFETFQQSGATIVLTGDVHSSWANELVPDANPANAPVGVEFVAPSASTRPFASNVSGATPPFEAAFTAANPWIKFCDMDANGFLVVDLSDDRAVARWFQVDPSNPANGASQFAAWETTPGDRRLLPHLVS